MKKLTSKLKILRQNENEDEKNWENKFDFRIWQIKIRLYDNFHENLRKKEIGPFFKTFLTNWGKAKVKMKKFGKISSIIEFSILKLGGMAILMKIWWNFCSSNFYLRRTYLEMLEGLSWWIYFDVRIWLTTKFKTFLLCLQSAGI